MNNGRDEGWDGVGDDATSGERVDDAEWVAAEERRAIQDEDGSVAQQTNPLPRLVVRDAPIAPRPRRQRADVEIVAPHPDFTGAPGEHVGTCISAYLKRRGNKLQAVLVFDIGGAHAKMWIGVPEPLTPTCRFIRLVTIALGRLLPPDTPIQVEDVFPRKQYRLLIGWNKAPQKNGRHYAERCIYEGPKFVGDFVRCHDILECLTHRT